MIEFSVLGELSLVKVWCNRSGWLNEGRSKCELAVDCKRGFWGWNCSLSITRSREIKNGYNVNKETCMDMLFTLRLITCIYKK